MFVSCVFWQSPSTPLKNNQAAFLQNQQWIPSILGNGTFTLKNFSLEGWVWWSSNSKGSMSSVYIYFPLRSWRGTQRCRVLVVNQDQLSSTHSVHMVLIARMVLTTIGSSSVRPANILCAWANRHEGKTHIHIKEFQFLDSYEKEFSPGFPRRLIT